MHSIKNTVVAVFLLGVTYTVYQSISTPEPITDEAELLNISVEDNSQLYKTDGSNFLDNANQSMNGIAKKLEQSVDGFGQKAGDTAIQLVNDASKIPDNLLNDPQWSNGINASEIKHRAENIAATFPQNTTSSAAPPLLENKKHDQELIARLNSTLDNASENSKLLKSNIPSLPAQGRMTNVKPRPSDIAAGEIKFDSSVMPVSTSTRTLSAFWPEVDAMVRNREFNKALKELSVFYNSSSDSADPKLLKWLDLLAAKVIYSSEHHLRSTPYIVQPGDKIADLARRWQIPAQLIYNTNRRKISDPNRLTPGTELKIIQGPFDAVIDSGQGVMTMFLQGLYAGRFDVRPGKSLPDGEFRIVDKSVAGKTGMPHWISLSNGSSIYGTDQGVDNSNVGLAPQEAADLFAILSASSKVRILR